MMKDIDIFYFNELGEYDEFNPAFFLDRENASKLLYLIAKEPYKETLESLNTRMNGDYKEILDGLVNINALSIKDNKYKVNFPVFFEDDVKIIIKEIKPYLNTIMDSIKSVLNEFNYNKEELYHILCNNTFDNYSLKYLMDKWLIRDYKKNPGNRNYIIIGYEKSDFVNDYSNKLLCSNNRYKCNYITFNSFGDTDGARKDLYRYFRLKQQGKNPFKEINVYMSSINKDQEVLEKNLVNAINGKGDKDTIKLLNNLEYMIGNEICVPVLINDGYKYLGLKVMDSIIDIIKDIFEKVRLLDITPNRNEVSKLDTLNEVWHIIFGLINEELVKEGIVETPEYKEGEGRYLKCIYRSDIFNVDDLKVHGDTFSNEGYRLVHYKDNECYIGTYSNSLEAFMYELNEYEPSDEMEEFISTEDFLKRYLGMYKSDDELRIYTVNGELVDSLKRDK